MNHGKPEVRPVEIGYDNNRMILIKSGLKPGEQVLLAPPLSDQKPNKGASPRIENDKPKDNKESGAPAGDGKPKGKRHG
jgi:hypothetical protein